jgi:hypothetical protein
MDTLLDDVRADARHASVEGGSCRRRVESMQRRLQAARVAAFLLLVGCTATAGAWMMSPQLRPDHSEIGLRDASLVLRESTDREERDRAVTVGTLRVLEFIEALKSLPAPTMLTQPRSDLALNRIREAVSK